jgi:MarR family transcriptional regulator, temperature-dependent positive regulator of motility
MFGMAQPRVPLWYKAMAEDSGEPASDARSLGPIYRVPSHLARRLNQLCIRMIAEPLRAVGLVPPQFGMLAAIETEPGIDQRRLADRLGIDRTNTGKFLDHLEEMGLVERRVDPCDRRVRTLRVTPRGSELRRRLRPAMLAAQDRALGPLTPEEKVTLVRLLVRVVEANDEHARPGAGRRPRRPRALAAGQAERDRVRVRP